MDETENITPEDSVVSVFLDTAECPEVESPVIVDVSAQRAAGVAKLMRLGLTEAEANAVAGN